MSNPFEIPEEAERYLEENSSPESDILQAISRHTWLNEIHPQMISGQVQGWFFRMISRMLQPESILEIGTFTAYSTIALCDGLRQNGRVITIEINEEYEPVCRRHFRLAGLEERIELIIGAAEEVIPQLKGSFDLALIDARKEDYSTYYRLIIDKMNPGGIILADNVLWGGKVLSTSGEASAEAVNAFNQLVTRDERVDNVLGIMLIRKR